MPEKDLADALKRIEAYSEEIARYFLEMSEDKPLKEAAIIHGAYINFKMIAGIAHAALLPKDQK